MPTSVPAAGISGTAVARLDVDTEAAATLAEAIEAGLAAVKMIPDLSVPVLDVPAQPARVVDAQ